MLWAWADFVDGQRLTGSPSDRKALYAHTATLGTEEIAAWSGSFVILLAVKLLRPIAKVSCMSFVKKGAVKAAGAVCVIVMVGFRVQ